MNGNYIDVVLYLRGRLSVDYITGRAPGLSAAITVFNPTGSIGKQ